MSRPYCTIAGRLLQKISRCGVGFAVIRQDLLNLSRSRIEVRESRKPWLAMRSS
jgi:hypothetical protein